LKIQSRLVQELPYFDSCVFLFLPQAPFLSVLASVGKKTHPSFPISKRDVPPVDTGTAAGILLPTGSTKPRRKRTQDSDE
jgi:hypothetical protein